MTDFSGFRQTGGYGPIPMGMSQNTQPPQQFNQMPYGQPSQTIRPFNLAAAGGGGPARPRPSLMQYGRPVQGGMPIQMGGPGQFGNSGSAPMRMGQTQYPGGGLGRQMQMGMPPRQNNPTQGPFQMGGPDPTVNGPYQMGDLTPW